MSKKKKQAKTNLTNTNNLKILAIVGESCTGKSELESRLAKQGFHKAISFTTRPQRDGEVNGVDYYYITNEEFDKLEKENKLYEQTSYIVDGEVWHYGLTRESFVNDKPNVVVINFDGLKQLLQRKELEDKIFVLVMESELDDRIIRYLKRENVDIYDDKHSKKSSIVKNRLLQRLIQDHRDFKVENLEFFEKFKEKFPENYAYWQNNGMDFKGIEEIEKILVDAIKYQNIDISNIVSQDIKPDVDKIV